uniref:Uncharacterized protein n=1 Tax=Skeletonema marinoi TaxID=267567 RepID=A0A7S2KFV2_9STRA
MLYEAATVCILYEAATFLLCHLRRTDTTLLVASYYIQLGGIEMVLLCIDDYIASSILLYLTPNIKDCRYDHVIDSSTIPTATYYYLITRTSFLPVYYPSPSPTTTINRKMIYTMICYYHRSVTY